MAIHIDKAGASFLDDGSPKLYADRALFADAALSVLLEAGDSAAAFQIASRAGKLIPKHFVDALGLYANADGEIMQPCKESDAKQSAPAEDKSVAPAENKSGTKSSASKAKPRRRKKSD